jgi:hypothetical protein
MLAIAAFLAISLDPRSSAKICGKNFFDHPITG